jgi:hypothetical protein
VQWIVGSHVCRPVSIVFGGSILQGKSFGKYASVTECVSPDVLQSLWVMILE